MIDVAHVHSRRHRCPHSPPFFSTVTVLRGRCHGTYLLQPGSGACFPLQRRDAGCSDRAMLVLANFYYKGDYGVGYNPGEAKRLLTQAADLGDPSAKEALVNLERNLADDAAKEGEKRH